jgi:hypothetical protein
MCTCLRIEVACFRIAWFCVAFVLAMHDLPWQRTISSSGTLVAARAAAGARAVTARVTGGEGTKSAAAPEGFFAYVYGSSFNSQQK